jgi:peptidoglycan hydrolase CwlO-like protein
MVHQTPRAAVAVLTAGLLLVPSAGAASTSSLQGRLDAQQRRAQGARQGLHADQARLRTVTARVKELEAQLAPLDADLDRDGARLDELQTELRDTRARLVKLRAESARDQKILAAQLVAQYEDPRPGLAEVVLNSHGYSDLLSRVGQLKQVAKRNAEVTVAVTKAKSAADRTAKHLTDLAATKAATVASERTRRDAVAHVRLEVVQQQASIERSRDAHSAHLKALGRREDQLRKQLVKAQRAAAKAAGVPLSGGTTPSGGYGFFPAAGTNYSVHDEPELARRLNKMGKELHLHLIGLSGYRTPQHSVEVGGFANDPHTRGEASDTPGLEGVPEGTLNAYGLTRPFPGAAEADHVQLHGAG